MPAHPALEARVTEVLGDPTSPEYPQAKGIVAGAATLTDAVQNAGFFLGPLAQEYQNEINTMLGLLPPDVAQDILDALKDAVRHDARVVLMWNKHPNNGFDFSHAMGNGVAHMELRTPEPPPP